MPFGANIQFINLSLKLSSEIAASWNKSQGKKRNEQYARQEGKLTKNQIGVADNRPTFVTLINQSGAVDDCFGILKLNLSMFVSIRKC